MYSLIKMSNDIDGVYAVLLNGEIVDYFRNKSNAEKFIKDPDNYIEPDINLKTKGRIFPKKSSKDTIKLDNTSKDTIKLDNTSHIDIKLNINEYKKKSDIVREAIRQVKQNHGNMIDVIEFAINNLEMTSHLAKTYTKNNWNKV